METSRVTSFLTKLKRAIAKHKLEVGLMLLWVYTVAIYYFQFVGILMFRDIAVIVMLGVPMIIAVVGLIELLVRRLFGTS
jgi:hypothetical protein